MTLRVAEHKNPGLLNSDFDSTSRHFSVADLSKYCAVAEYNQFCTWKNKKNLVWQEGYLQLLKKGALNFLIPNIWKA